MAFKFEVRHHGNHDKLGLATMLQAFADEEWVAEHMTAEQAAFSVIDRFSRIVKSELELVEVIAKPPTSADYTR
ncbi:hypothetical protein [Roseiconus lacunae]|uniref:Uncharacterized protein n=1 Tax=Roseiconus lacunae TaxID=2605694 RepID=A0ABT7PS69_9BACT|nr:hypothetical protein [Roseiconus lacunae]MDM4019337.1 hypothetical protein [Roseiconus lacunae]